MWIFSKDLHWLAKRLSICFASHASESPCPCPNTWPINSPHQLSVPDKVTMHSPGRGCSTQLPRQHALQGGGGRRWAPEESCQNKMHLHPGRRGRTENRRGWWAWRVPRTLAADAW
eukprot:776931-Rhodomonas_salina.2